jgi:hypothetical protein
MRTLVSVAGDGHLSPERVLGDDTCGWERLYSTARQLPPHKQTAKQLNKLQRPRECFSDTSSALGTLGALWMKRGSLSAHQDPKSTQHRATKQQNGASCVEQQGCFKLKNFGRRKR